MNYNTAPRPTFHLAAFAIAVMLGLVAVDMALDGGVRAWLLNEQISTRLFVLLLLFYFAQWMAYFFSVIFQPLRIQSLRVLLFSSSGEPDVSTVREKGRSVLTTQAIFTAISVFVISALYRGGGPSPDPFTDWNSLSFYLVLGAAVCAVVLLIVSADAVETTFNEFGPTGQHFVQYFYKVSRYRKYYGFVLAVLSVILFVSRISPAIGCLAVILFLVCGYHLWFPSPNGGTAWLNFFAYLALIAIFVAAGHYYIRDGLTSFV
ncbi:MAG: hypothetical protein AAGA87_02655 [Pseudomonadota bacterium]